MSDQIIQQFELLLGSIGVILALFFGGFLLISRDQRPKANLFLAIYLLILAIRIGKSLFHYYLDIPATFRTYILATLFCVGPSIWLYLWYLKNNVSKIRSRDWMHFIPFGILLLTAWLIPNDGTSPVFSWFYDATILHMIGYIIFSAWWFSQNRSSDEEQQVNSWLWFFIIGNLILVILYFLISKVFTSLYIGISIAFSLLVVVMAFRALQSPALFTTTRPKYESSLITEDIAIALANRIKGLMESDKLYLQPDLSLSKLSKHLEVKSKDVSQAINQVFGVNYAKYIAQHRIREAQHRLLAPEYEHLSIAAIAHDSGFNSISSFNEKFKQQVGMTAHQFRKQEMS